MPAKPRPRDLVTAQTWSCPLRFLAAIFRLGGRNRLDGSPCRLESWTGRAPDIQPMETTTPYTITLLYHIDLSLGPEGRRQGGGEAGLTHIFRGPWTVTDSQLCSEVLPVLEYMVDNRPWEVNTAHGALATSLRCFLKVAFPVMFARHASQRAAAVIGVGNNPASHPGRAAVPVTTLKFVTVLLLLLSKVAADLNMPHMESAAG
ncbi:hypothetical protein CDV36_016643, partial [Fusarium kuroshium]